MTRINLRRAALLQDKIRKTITTLRPPLAITVSIWENDVDQKINDQRRDVVQRQEAITALTRILFGLRRKVGVLNAGKVNGLLADLAEVDFQLENLKLVAEGEVGGENDILKSRIQHERKRETPAVSYGASNRESISHSIITAEMVAAAKASVIALQRQRLSIEDELLAANTGTFIDLDQADADLLVSLGLI